MSSLNPVLENLIYSIFPSETINYIALTYWGTSMHMVLMCLYRFFGVFFVMTEL